MSPARLVLCPVLNRPVSPETPWRTQAPQGRRRDRPSAERPASGPRASRRTVCVCNPLTTVILTKRGWLERSDVIVGDETIGYNRKTERSEWTRVTAVHHYDDASLVRLGNSRWHATTTPEHYMTPFARFSPCPPSSARRGFSQ
jgi:hypothetical protein